MVFIFDNYDSFTYNLVQLVETLGREVHVVANDITDIAYLEEMKPEQIIISPGPGRPENAGLSVDLIHRFYKKIPILGVCLGLQCIGLAFGVPTQPAKRMLHGMTTPVFHKGSLLFKGVSNPFDAARYHSLAIKNVPTDFHLSAWDDKNEILGIEHKIYPLFGVQFHPESFMTPQGKEIIKNFLKTRITHQ